MKEGSRYMSNRFRHRRQSIEHSKVDKPEMVWIRYPINGKMVPAQILKRGPLFLRVIITGTDTPLTLTRQKVVGLFSYVTDNIWLETNGEVIKS